jgi:hypothetical protein
MGSFIEIDKQKVKSSFINVVKNAAYRWSYEYLNSTYGTTFEYQAKKLANGIGNIFGIVDRNALAGHLITNPNTPIGITVLIDESYFFPTNELFTLSREGRKNTLPKDIFPIAVRYITNNGEYIIERPPFKAKVDFRVNGSNKVSQEVEFWVPWTLTVIDPQQINKTRIYFGSKQLSSNDDLYISSTLPNSFASGGICFGGSLNTDEITQATNEFELRQLYSLILNEYMTGGWNIDLDCNMRIYTSYFKYLEEDSMEYKYHNVSVEDIKNKYPRMKLSAINKLILEHQTSHYNRINEFKYMFFALSTFTLEETLQLYDELIDANKDSSHCYKFTDIVNGIDNDIQTNVRNYARFNSIITSKISHAITYNNVTKIIEFIIINYAEGTPKEKYSKSIEDLVDNYGLKIFHVIEALKDSPQLENDQQALAVIDIKNDTLHVEIIDKKDYGKRYLELLINNNSIPYVEEATTATSSMF